MLHGVKVVTLGTHDMSILVTPAAVPPEGPFMKPSPKHSCCATLPVEMTLSAGGGPVCHPSALWWASCPLTLLHSGAVASPGFIFCAVPEPALFKHHSHHSVFQRKTTLESEVLHPWVRGGQGSLCVLSGDVADLPERSSVHAPHKLRAPPDRFPMAVSAQARVQRSVYPFMSKQT